MIRASHETYTLEFLAPGDTDTNPLYEVRPPSLEIDLEIIREEVSGAK